MPPLPPPPFAAPAFVLGGSLQSEGIAAMASATTPPAPSGPAPGSAELPSAGSEGHSLGRCKPCAFLHTKGCGNGVLCQFCHLCEPGEKKRRQKEKLMSRRAEVSSRQMPGN